jgi:hypothetical protein
MKDAKEHKEKRQSPVVMKHRNAYVTRQKLCSEKSPNERGAQFVKNTTIASFRDDITLAPGFFLQIACF